MIALCGYLWGLDEGRGGERGRGRGNILSPFTSCISESSMLRRYVKRISFFAYRSGCGCSKSCGMNQEKEKGLNEEEKERDERHDKKKKKSQPHLCEKERMSSARYDGCNERNGSSSMTSAR